ncbi:hypothetical protein UFOVP643_12 [uncultured Caudovirales phage]|uniref:DUF5681 domain-containing protein n=1 Tax=uncultured Caudovirales phage TaxID=2100421 RepID=A0A6J5LJD4_9CAUD|nr:hypothetical protein UFOVP282_23 [uncultured Caudovirales phage]CAB4154569.1 hypothetical protein UFOVP643_12 [uncultured Caudovirales phage]
MAQRGNPNLVKGVSGNPAGKPKGTLSKSTEAVKAYYLDLLNGNLDNIQEWLNRTAENDPKGALDFLIKLSPFVIPKKTETEMTIDSPLNIIIPSPKQD